MKLKKIYVHELRFSCVDDLYYYYKCDICSSKSKLFLKDFKMALLLSFDLLSKIIKLLNETFGSIKELRILKKEKQIEEIFLSSVYSYNKNFFYFNVIQKLPKILLEVIFLTLLMVLTIFFIKIFYW